MGIGRACGVVLAALLALPACGAEQASIDEIKTVLSVVGLNARDHELALVAALPRPVPLTEAESREPCRRLSLQFESELARKQWEFHWKVLRYWIAAHSGRRMYADGCDNEKDLLLRRWQAALGNASTGRLTEQEASELVRAVTEIESGRAPQFVGREVGLPSAVKAPGTATAESRRDAAEGSAPAQAAAFVESWKHADREPAIFDFLPAGPAITRNDCIRFRSAAQRSTPGRGLDFLTFDRWGPPVPEHWQSTWRNYPEISAWVEKYVPKEWDCMNVPRLQAWLNAIGETQDMRDRGSARKTEAMIEEARRKLHAATYAFASQRSKDGRGPDKAWREHPAAPASTAELSRLRPGVRQADALAQLPKLLCRANAEVIDCEKDDGCAEERTAIWNKSPNKRHAFVQEQIKALERVLAECETDLAKTGYKDSAIQLFGSNVRTLRLSFPGGRFGGATLEVSDPEGFRQAASARAGKPDIKVEVETRVRSVVVGEESYCPPGEGEVGGGCKPFREAYMPITGTQTTTVEHKRYFWRTPSMAVSEYEGKVELSEPR
jgi:hypothetical protein